MTTETPTPVRPHVDVLDGLRAMAIALVMWLHTWQLSWMSNSVQVAGFTLNWGVIPETGFLGVELFFFISGFCLFFPYARHVVEGRPKPAIATYAYRRAIKILPSYWLALLLLAPFAEPAFSSLGTWAWQLGTHLLFIHNWFLETKDSIDGVFWSLGVEVQFYVLFPLIAWAFARRPFLTYLAMGALALGWRLGVTQHFPVSDGPYWLNQLPGYLDFFANGMLAAFALVAWRASPHATRWRWVFTAGALAGFAALAWLMYDVYGLRYQMPFWPVGWQVVHRTYLGLAFLLIALGTAGAIKPWRALFANRPLLFLSTISYNLYIWHQVIARGLYNHHVPVPATADPHGDPTWQWQYMLIAVTVSILVSTLITYGFERPLLEHGPRGLLAKLRGKPDAYAEEQARAA